MDVNRFKLVAVYSLEEERAKCTWLEADVVDRLSVRSSNLSDSQLPVRASYYKLLCDCWLLVAWQKASLIPLSGTKLPNQLYLTV